MSFPTSLIPANDRERLLALAPYRVLGTAPDAVFDEIIRLTAKLFDVPIALVSLVEEGSVWFKANFGLAGVERVARNESVCSVAILQEETTIYQDLHADPCQLTDARAAEALQMRFYAGHPLQDHTGHNIGALCVIDRQPRQFSATEQHRLQRLARVVMQLLEIGNSLVPASPPRAYRRYVGYAVRPPGHVAQPPRHPGRISQLGRLSPATPAALNYQQSREEESIVIIQALEQQVAHIQATLPH
ncbi:GAF domain-containing protein [Hymenobacter sp. HMF4947]|uniref:GAF domain-containing protein n=1 Tax=Hymenobacter ginkgonis TaxID=2682976 RepID=A0A7K1T8P5_9BACT|nr:GAF domain-containing protein [Hymenobacter ginkgonis]MVN74777.1 GAF domain-containing protein [Hymenobacter ginkgonis]